MPESSFESAEAAESLKVVDYEAYQQQRSALEALTDPKKNRYGSIMTSDLVAQLENGPAGANYVDEIVTRGPGLRVTTTAIQDPSQAYTASNAPAETGGYRVNVTVGKLLDDRKIIIRDKDRAVAQQIHQTILEQARMGNTDPVEWLLEESSFSGLKSADYEGQSLLGN